MNINPQGGQELKIHKKNFISRILRTSTIKEDFPLQMEHDTAEAQEILACIRSARSQWAVANANFEYANEQELVDYYTYEIKACQVRYEYYIKRAKELGIKVDTLDLPSIYS